ncbi:MAG: hypothetical protein V3S89_10330, partial [Desulfobacterales bacterium]
RVVSDLCFATKYRSNPNPAAGGIRIRYQLLGKTYRPFVFFGEGAIVFCVFRDSDGRKEAGHMTSSPIQYWNRRNALGKS